MRDVRLLICAGWFACAAACAEPLLLAQSEAPESAPAGAAAAASGLEGALARIEALQVELTRLNESLAARNRDYDLLDREVSRLRQRLAEESEARIILERKLAIAEENGALIRPAAEAADPRYGAAAPAPIASDEPLQKPPEAVAPAVRAPSMPVMPIANAPAQPEVPPAAEPIPAAEASAGAILQQQPKIFRGTGEFSLARGDRWAGDGDSDGFEVLSVSADSRPQSARAEIIVFGEPGVAELGARFSRTMESGLYRLTVMSVDGPNGIVRLLVERKG